MKFYSGTTFVSILALGFSLGANANTVLKLKLTDGRQGKIVCGMQSSMEFESLSGFSSLRMNFDSLSSCESTARNILNGTYNTRIEKFANDPSPSRILLASEQTTPDVSLVPISTKTAHTYTNADLDRVRARAGGPSTNSITSKGHQVTGLGGYSQKAVFKGRVLNLSDYSRSAEVRKSLFENGGSVTATDSSTNSVKVNLGVPHRNKAAAH